MANLLSISQIFGIRPDIEYHGVNYWDVEWMIIGTNFGSQGLDAEFGIVSLHTGNHHAEEDYDVIDDGFVFNAVSADCY